MATTYGYGGEFSSDEDVDRIEQQAERMVQSRFNDNFSARPSAKQVDEAIEAIRNLSPDEDINLTDELLAGLLDHFKTHRGPIVDSTRKLYKKIVMRIIREGSKKPDNETNGSSNHNSNNNNNDIEIIASKQKATIDSFSSDEEEPIAPVSFSPIERQSNVNILSKQNNDAKVDDDAENSDKMEIDSETPSGLVRESKQVELSTDDENDDLDSSEESDSEEQNCESDVIDLTPIKSHQQQRQQPTVINSDKARAAVSALSTPKRNQPESSVKRQPLAQSTPKESVKKPYTRSQRLAAARAATSKDKASDSFIDKSAATSSNDGGRGSRRRYLILVAVTALIALIAFLIFQFRASIAKKSASSNLFGNKINFG